MRDSCINMMDYLEALMVASLVFFRTKNLGVKVFSGQVLLALLSFIGMHPLKDPLAFGIVVETAKAEMMLRKKKKINKK